MRETTTQMFRSFHSLPRKGEDNTLKNVDYVTDAFQSSGSSTLSDCTPIIPPLQL